MKHIRTLLHNLVSTSSDYIELRMRLMVLQLSEKISKILSDFFTLLILIIVFLFALLLFSVGLAKWIGHAMNNEWAGFFIVGAFYLLVGIILLISKEKIIRLPILNSIVKGFFTIENEAEKTVENVEANVKDKLN